MRLAELAKYIRSKNAGVDKITFDIVFPDEETYERVKRSRILTRESVAKFLGIPTERIADFVNFDPAWATKFTIYRTLGSGSAGDPDIFGAQQYGPLLDMEVPLESEVSRSLDGECGSTLSEQGQESTNGT